MGKEIKKSEEEAAEATKCQYQFGEYK